LPLADAARYGGTLANIYAVFVPIDADNEFHGSSHFSPWPAPVPPIARRGPPRNR
jgi:hypothetical protein